MYDIITFTQEIPEKKSMISCLQIENNVTIIDFIAVTIIDDKYDVIMTPMDRDFEVGTTLARNFRLS